MSKIVSDLNSVMFVKVYNGENKPFRLWYKVYRR